MVIFDILVPVNDIFLAVIFLVVVLHSHKIQRLFVLKYCTYHHVLYIPVS